MNQQNLIVVEEDTFLAEQFESIIALSQMSKDEQVAWKIQALEELENWYSFEKNRIDEMCNSLLRECRN